MPSLLPVSLIGDNLGQRHQHLNSLVRKAKDSGNSFHDVEDLPEQSPVDRLFKIDLAVQLKNVDYIIRQLKDDDMLYVSRALKSTWLIDHRDIVNPKYLEDVLFPEMLAPAVSKMKHWLYINLREPAMCQEFYQHYKENTFEFAIKFLSHCSNEFILEEVPKILNKISTHSLKVLCEKCPKVAKIYFDSLATDEDVKNSYLKQEKSYYNSVKCVLKSDADVFLDITEKYFNINSFSRFSPLATDYILRYHKTRFTNKLELYVAYFLHIPTLAARLSVEECQEVVLKLARASYLQQWFQYKVVEPLIKRLSPDKRAAFKKRVFVDKDVGDSVEKWPYDLPAPPTESYSGVHVFDDQDFASVIWIHDDNLRMGDMMKCCAMRAECYEDEECMIRVKTDLDRLFDEFRFVGFEHALLELGQRLSATSSADRRRDIFLVLVSKSGGRIDAVSALLRLAVRHSNEPAHTRASVLRSLVKRASVWRLPDDVWQLFLDFGHGLGLDGTPAEAACSEGLHAVVIRQLLAGKCKEAIRDAFFNDFSTLADYALKADERVRVATSLQNMMAEAAQDESQKDRLEVAVKRLGQLLDVLKIYRVRVEPTSPTVKTAIALALKDPDVARPLLEQLYDARIARRELLRLNMEFRRDEAAQMNALRHDPSALELKRLVDILVARETSFDNFTSKLTVYFSQKEDFIVRLRSALKDKIAEQQKEKFKNVKLARPLTSVLFKDFLDELRDIDAADKDHRRFAAALRACARRARPIVNLAEWGWRKAGVKAVATRAMRCREVERAELTRALAAERRTVRVALALSIRSAGGLVLDTFASAAKLRPIVALIVALLYFRRHQASADFGVWNIVKPLFSSVDLAPRERLRRSLGNTDWIPSAIKPDYCATLYLAVYKISGYSAQMVLSDLSKLLAENDGFIEEVLLRILENTDEDMTPIPYPAIFIRYLMLSRNEDDVQKRFEKIGNRFLERMDTLRIKKDENFEGRLDQTFESLKYNSAFLDTKYDSCLSVIEKILAWMQKFMPKEEHFKNFVQIHLTMLYFKAIRQSLKQAPELFADPKRRKSEGVETVGFIFGRYIVKEVAELVRTYFDSITELYTDALVDYLNQSFGYGDSTAKFIGCVLKGILAEGDGVQRRIAVYVLEERRFDINKEMREEIVEQVSKENDMKIFLHAGLLTYC